MKSSILIIYTGGTIGMKNDAETGALVPFDFSGIYDEFPSLKRLNVDIDVLTMDPVIDSSNVTPANWAALAELIRDNYTRYDGFVVLHGTDTMSYTASALSFMLENLAKPVVFTGSQIPIGVLRTDGRENLITAIEIAGAHIGGRPELIAPLSQQAMDLGLDGLIIEAHCSPDCAWSDKAQQVTPQGLAYICRNLVIRETNATTESLTELRSQIDKLDDELLELLSRRMRVSRDIGQYKKEHNMPVLQAQRYEELLARRADQAIRMGMDREFMRSVLQAIHEESIRQQMAVLGE